MDKHLEDCECSECCDHMDMDNGYCLDCDEDLTEFLMMKAYDMYKDRD